MSLDIWLSFLLACTVLCFTPGPTVLLVVGQAFIQGRKSSIPLVLGVLCGDIIALTLSLIGVGSILAMSSEVFFIMKWCGAIYLIYLGVSAFTTKQIPEREQLHSANATVQKNMKLKAFRQSMIVTALNPKGIIFFMAFFPLFINPEAPLVTQLAILSSTFMLVSAASATSYVLAASQLVQKLKNPKVQNYFNRASGGMLVTAGVLTASLNKD